MHFINLMVTYVDRKYGVPTINFFSKIWPEVESHLKAILGYKYTRPCLIYRIKLTCLISFTWDPLTLSERRESEKFKMKIIYMFPFLYARLQTGRIMVRWCPSVRVSVRPTVRPTLRPSVRPSDSPSGCPSARFPHFSHTCFDILSWNFAHDFVLMYYRSSLNVVTLRQFLKELCLFVNLEYR